MTKTKKIKAMASEIEVQERVAYMQEMLVAGTRKGIATKMFMEKYSLSMRSAQIYINKAYAAFAKQNRNKLEGIKGYHAEIRRQILEQAMAALAKGFDTFTAGTALAVLKDIAKIEGAYEPIAKVDGLSTGVLMALGNFVQKLELGDLGKETFTELCTLLAVPKENIERILLAVKAAEDNMEGYDIDAGLIKKYVK